MPEDYVLLKEDLGKVDSKFKKIIETQK